MLLSLVPLPYRILAIALLAVALFGFGWIKGAQHGERKLDGYKLALAGQSLRIQTETIAKTKALQAQKDEALNAAAKRSIALKVDADRARTELDGLRNDNANFRAVLPSLADDAVKRYASAASVVLDQCSAEVARLAEVSDGWSNEALTLRQAWPR